MKLEDQCVSLDLAKRLFELGIDQTSLYIWENSSYEWQVTAIKKNYIYKNFPGSTIYAAYSVAELGEMLPVTIICEKHRHGNWRVISNSSDMFSHVKLGDAMAKMLLHLIENNLWKLE